MYTESPGTGVSSKGIMVLSHGDCEGVTINLLEMFQRLVVCIKERNLAVRIGSTELEVQQADALLTEWLALKRIDPASCAHQQKLPIIQVLITKIVAFGQC